MLFIADKLRIKTCASDYASVQARTELEMLIVKCIQVQEKVYKFQLRMKITYHGFLRLTKLPVMTIFTGQMIDNDEIQI